MNLIKNLFFSIRWKTNDEANTIPRSFQKKISKNSPTWLCLEKPFSRGACKKLDMSAAPKYYFSRDKRPFDFSKTLSVMRRQQLSKNGDNYFREKSFHKIFQKPVTNIFLQIC